MSRAARPAVRVVRGREASPRAAEGALVVRVADARVAPRAAAVEARVSVSIADPREARAMAAGVARAIAEAADRAIAACADRPRIVRVRTRARLARLGPERVAGAIAIVRVTDRGARRLAEIVAELRAAGVLGVQVVWDEDDASLRGVRAHVERHVFAALEAARAAPAGPPVVLARTEEPAAALRILAAHRTPRGDRC